ncbi:MAG: SRPBCC domain-containing protein [Candidatus Moranbacteria bacterium]|nr:SRPBCC domain-containing protein [Candidatus Moranbacteria bacterium]
MNEKLHYETVINAPAQKVWDTMLDLETYKQWTKVFEPTSYYEGSWEKGSKMKFLGTGNSGMLSEIAENIPQKFISIRHIGLVTNGVEDTTSDEAKKWSQGTENYTFIEKGKETLLKIDLEFKSSEGIKEMSAMFGEMWPKALKKLKEMCEA